MPEKTIPEIRQQLARLEFRKMIVGQFSLECPLFELEGVLAELDDLEEHIHEVREELDAAMWLEERYLRGH